mmetsp:Transcript_34857/g.99198  ORF Transcript_34857/g.99198 Transcript_34857/m.99198 type:complete len:104 (-) Transcript_34857:618-929(-)
MVFEQPPCIFERKLIELLLLLLLSMKMLLAQKLLQSRLRLLLELLIQKLLDQIIISSTIVATIRDISFGGFMPLPSILFTGQSQLSKSYSVIRIFFCSYRWLL